MAATGMRVVLTLRIARLVAFSQPPAFDELAKLFQNDPNQPTHERITAIQGSAGVLISSIRLQALTLGVFPACSSRRIDAAGSR